MQSSPRGEPAVSRAPTARAEPPRPALHCAWLALSAPGRHSAATFPPQVATLARQVCCASPAAFSHAGFGLCSALCLSGGVLHSPPSPPLPGAELRRSPVGFCLSKSPAEGSAQGSYPLHTATALHRLPSSALPVPQGRWKVPSPGWHSLAGVPGIKSGSCSAYQRRGTLRIHLLAVSTKAHLGSLLTSPGKQKAGGAP